MLSTRVESLAETGLFSLQKAIFETKHSPINISTAISPYNMARGYRIDEIQKSIQKIMFTISTYFIHLETNHTINKLVLEFSITSLNHHSHLHKYYL